MSTIFVRASRVCSTTSARAVCSASTSVLRRRSVLTSSITPNCTSPVYYFANSAHAATATPYGSSRRQSALATSRATATATSDDAPLPETTNKSPHFSTLNGVISDAVLEAITVKPMKLTHMSAVQAEIFPLLPQLAEPYTPDTPRDLLVRAKTGTGKTLAFLVPAIEARLKSIKAHVKQAVQNSGLGREKVLEARAERAMSRDTVGTLILSPTRELASQIAEEASRLTSHLDLEVRLFVGGASRAHQIRAWSKGRRDIVVSTPGRLLDFLSSEPGFSTPFAKTQVVMQNSFRCQPHFADVDVAHFGRSGYSP